MWTPYIIDVILHHHTSHAMYPNHSAPLYQPTIVDLIDNGILVNSGEHLTTSDLGKALVELWCSTPLPVVKFVDPRFYGDTTP